MKTITINFGSWKGAGGGDAYWWKVYTRLYIFGLWTPFCIVEWKGRYGRKISNLFK